MNKLVFQFFFPAELYHFFQTLKYDEIFLKYKMYTVWDIMKKIELAFILLTVFCYCTEVKANYKKI